MSDLKDIITRASRAIGRESLKDELDAVRRRRALRRFTTGKVTSSSTTVIIPEERLRVVALDISEELRQLHMRDQAHGNLTPSTIGFDPTNGRATLIPVQRKDNDIRYRAPEAMHAIIEDVDPKCDVYSFALILWEVATLELPYESILGKTLQAQEDSNGLRRQQLIEQVGRKHVRPKLFKVPSRELRELLQLCWDPNPDARPTLMRVWYMLHHKIFPVNLEMGCSSTMSDSTSSVALEARIVPYLVATNKRLTIKTKARNSLPVGDNESMKEEVQRRVEAVSCSVVHKQDYGRSHRATSRDTHSNRTSELTFVGHDYEDDDESIYSDEDDQSEEIGDYRESLVPYCVYSYRR